MEASLFLLSQRKAWLCSWSRGNGKWVWIYTDLPCTYMKSRAGKEPCHKLWNTEKVNPKKGGWLSWLRCSRTVCYTGMWSRPGLLHLPLGSRTLGGLIRIYWMSKWRQEGRSKGRKEGSLTKLLQKQGQDNRYWSTEFKRIEWRRAIFLDKSEEVINYVGIVVSFCGGTGGSPTGEDGSFWLGWMAWIFLVSCFPASQYSHP